MLEVNPKSLAGGSTFPDVLWPEARTMWLDTCAEHVQEPLADFGTQFQQADPH